MRKYLQIVLSVGLCLSFILSSSVVAATVSAPSQTKEQPLKVGGKVRSPKQTKYVAPEYPEEVRKRHPKGVIAVELILNPEGKVDSTRHLKGNAELARYAVEAAKKWEFEPTLNDGKASWLSLTVLIPFPNPQKGAGLS